MIPPFLSLGLCALSFVAMLAVNLIFKYSGMNFFFIFFFSIFFIFSLFRLPVKDPFYRYISIFTPCVFEIYLLHGYFFIKPIGNQEANFLISFAIVLILSIILNRFSKLTLKFIQRS